MFYKKPIVKVASRLKKVFESPSTLSTYFPEGTVFFYGYPSGEDSGFLNRVAPSTEELVAARALCCTGGKVSAVCFAATTHPIISEKLLDDFSVPKPSAQALVVPAEIDPSVQGNERNHQVKEYLKAHLKPGSLVMAQPFADADFKDAYQIPAEVTLYLNDKKNMQEYIDETSLPHRYGSFKNGAAFLKKASTLPLPVVIKASSSSAGDGVFLCRNKRDLERAAKKLASISGTIIVDQMIDFYKNYGVHFGVPHDKTKPIDLIGVNEQITSKYGEFMGGVIDSLEIPEALDGAVEHLINDILPKVRDMGWYGIGGFDILVDKEGEAYFIDCNFRMTGMSAYHFLVDKGTIKRPIMSISGEIEGEEADFRNIMEPFSSNKAKNKFLYIISMSRHGNTWRFNAALEYSNAKELTERAQAILDAGVESSVLSLVLK